MTFEMLPHKTYIKYIMEFEENVPNQLDQLLTILRSVPNRPLLDNNKTTIVGTHKDYYIDVITDDNNEKHRVIIGVVEIYKKDWLPTHVRNLTFNPSPARPARPKKDLYVKIQPPRPMKQRRRYRDIVTYVEIPAGCKTYGNNESESEFTVRVWWPDTLLSVEQIHEIILHNIDSITPGYDVLIVGPPDDECKKAIAEYSRPGTHKAFLARMIKWDRYDDEIDQRILWGNVEFSRIPFGKLKE